MKEKDECLKKDDMIQVLFMKLIHGYTANGFQKFKDLGVHPGQLPILSRLHEKEGASQRELADMLHIKPPTVTVTIRRLEKAELVYRKTDESDLRVTRIYLTEKGKDAVKDIHTLAEGLEKVLRRGFSKSEICLLRRFLQQMIDNLEQAAKQEESKEHD